MDSTKITSISMGSIYAEDYDDSFRFYNGVLGLDDYSPMGDKACYFNIGSEQGMYLEGGYDAPEYGFDTAKASFTFKVGSASQMFTKLILINCIYGGWVKVAFLCNIRVDIF